MMVVMVVMVVMMVMMVVVMRMVMVAKKLYIVRITKLVMEILQGHDWLQFYSHSEELSITKYVHFVCGTMTLPWKDLVHKKS